MNGATHYAEAERLLYRIGNCTSDSPEDKTLIASLAHVHATLALTAATVDASTGATREYSEWSQAVSS